MSSKHWNEIYSQKTNEEMSWFQEMPQRSLELIRELSLKPNTKIIDIGGGDSRLTDKRNVTVTMSVGPANAPYWEGVVSTGSHTLKK